jgi:ribonuclease Z
MFDLTFLGTAAAVPAADRGLPALLVDHGPRRFLIDCGEGTQRQVLASGVGFRRLDTIFLTHGHADHVLGLPGLAATLAQWESTPHLTICGGLATLDVVRALLDGAMHPYGEPGIEIRLQEIGPGTVWEDPDLRVVAFALQHTVPDCLGFRFEDKGPKMRLDPARLDALRVPPGPLRALLASGVPVDLPGGRRVEPEDVAAPSRPGPRVCVVGDTGPFPELVTEAAGADLLVCEATFLAAEAQRAAQSGHLTAMQAGQLALEAQVDALWLTHISHRHRGPEVQAEARQVFPTARVANDFDRVKVTARKD